MNAARRAIFGVLGLSACSAVTQPASELSAASAHAVPHDGRPLIVAGYDHACALDAHGDVYCWGSNEIAQIDPSARMVFAEPTKMSGLTDVVDLATFAYRTCALGRDGSVRCWGGRSLSLGIAASNLGNSSSSERTAGAIEPVQGVTHATRVVLGYRHLCVLEGSGGVRCGGQNEKGQLGDGTKLDHDDVRPIPGLGGVVDLVSSSDGVCALVADGTVRCWGSFDDADEGASSPVSIRGLPAMRSISGAPGGACGLAADGAAWCWGVGAPGSGKPDRNAPRKVADGMTGELLVATNDTLCAGGASISCVSTAEDKKRPGLASRAAALAALGHGGALGLAAASSGSFACTAFKDGAVACAGKNDMGQLGTGESYYVSPPRVVDGLRGVELNAKVGSSCALDASGAVSCIGTGPGTEVPITPIKPIAVAGLPAVTHLFDAAGGALLQSPYLDRCGTARDGNLHCWSGAGPARQIANLEHVVANAPAAGEVGLNYATLENGQVVGWIALEENDAVRAWRAELPAFAGLSHIVAREEAACGVHTSGKVMCWVPVDPQVDTSNDQLRMRVPPGLANPEVLTVPGVDGAVELAHGFGWCARTRDNKLFCWELEKNGLVLSAHEAALEQPPYRGITFLTGSSPREPRASGFGDLLCGVLAPGDRLACDHMEGSAPSAMLQGLIDANERPYNGVKSISLSSDGGCVSRANGEVACFGENEGGAKGVNTRESQETPALVHLPSVGR